MRLTEQFTYFGVLNYGIFKSKKLTILLTEI